MSEYKYFKAGDSVNQDAYPGCPAKVVEAIFQKHGKHTYFYRLEIDATGHPEAIDENGEPESTKFATISDTSLIALNP